MAQAMAAVVDAQVVNPGCALAAAAAASQSGSACAGAEHARGSIHIDLVRKLSGVSG